MKDGRFGPYVTDGETNATIPRGETVEEVDFDRAVQLLADKRAKGPVKKPAAKRATAAKKPAAKTAAAKTTAAKTTAAKTTAAKTTAAKKTAARRQREDGSGEVRGVEVERQETGGRVSDGTASHHANGGLFITLEGGDGTGKSTQAALLEEWLREQGRTVVRTREPGGTAVGVEIREIVLHHRGDIAPRAEALLYAADRAHHIATFVRPALERGRGRAPGPLPRLLRRLPGRRAGARRRARSARCRCGRPKGSFPTSRSSSTSTRPPPAPGWTALAPATTGWRPRNPTSTPACARRTSRSPRPNRTGSSSSTHPGRSTRSPPRSV